MKMLLRVRLCINEGNTKNENVLWKMDHDRVYNINSVYSCSRHCWYFIYFIYHDYEGIILLSSDVSKINPTY